MSRSGLPPCPMTAFSQPMGYRSYLLRFWQEHGESQAAAIWRFSLEDPLTGQRQGFASLDALTAWLRTELDPAGSARAAALNTPD